MLIQNRFYRAKGDKGEPGLIGQKGVPGQFIVKLIILLFIYFN